MLRKMSCKLIKVRTTSLVRGVATVFTLLCPVTRLDMLRAAEYRAGHSFACRGRRVIRTVVNLTVHVRVKTVRVLIHRVVLLRLLQVFTLVSNLFLFLKH